MNTNFEKFALLENCDELYFTLTPIDGFISQDFIQNLVFLSPCLSLTLELVLKAHSLI